jgi:glycerol uptake facilitator-like aquaporin
VLTSPSTPTGPAATPAPTAPAVPASPEPSPVASTARRLLAECLGTGVLTTVVVGSGIAAQRLSPDDVGLQLLESSVATALGLAAVILMVGPVSGAHLNPVVSACACTLGRRGRHGLSVAAAGGYAVAQLTGAVGGALLANAMCDVPIALATTERSGAGLWLGEVVATAGLVLLVAALVRTGRAALAAPAVAAYIGAAYWFTSSTAFANPAVTVGRMFTDTFAGIAPASVLPFVAAQVAGGALGAIVARVLYPVEGDVS